MTSFIESRVKKRIIKKTIVKIKKHSIEKIGFGTDELILFYIFIFEYIILCIIFFGKIDVLFINE